MAFIYCPFKKYLYIATNIIHFLESELIKNTQININLVL